MAIKAVTASAVTRRPQRLVTFAALRWTFAALRSVAEHMSQSCSHACVHACIHPSMHPCMVHTLHNAVHNCYYKASSSQPGAATHPACASSSNAPWRWQQHYPAAARVQQPSLPVDPGHRPGCRAPVWWWRGQHQSAPLPPPWPFRAARGPVQ